MRKGTRRVRFANETEQSFAALLHRLRLRWQYEPHMFVLRTKPDGSPALAFTPDFYLPDLGVYFELTTLRQRLVTNKNRKARLLAEQRPDVRVRLLYRRDCQEVLRPARSRGARELLLRKLLPDASEDVLWRARWLLCLPRCADSAGRVSVLGVRLPLGPEWAGRRVTIWIYPGVLEIELEGDVIARFPCSYDLRTRRFQWVHPGDVYVRPDVQQERLALPELERPQPRARRGRQGSYAAFGAFQLPLSL